MMDYINFWLAKFLADVIITVGFFVVVIVVAIAIDLRGRKK